MCDVCKNSAKVFLHVGTGLNTPEITLTCVTNLTGKKRINAVILPETE